MNFFLRIFSIGFFLFMSVSYAQTQEVSRCSATENLILVKVKQAIEDSTQELLVPLPEEWSEASGDILGMQVQSIKPIRSLRSALFSNNGQKIIEEEYKFSNNEILDFDWKKIISSFEDKKGELVFSLLDEAGIAICNEKVLVSFIDASTREEGQPKSNPFSKMFKKFSKMFHKDLSYDAITDSAHMRSESIDKKLLLKNFIKLGGDPISLKQLLCFQERFGNAQFMARGDVSRSKGIRIGNQRYLTINDLTKSSIEARMFVLDLVTGEVQVYYSTHGRGGKNGVPSNSPLKAESFSNIDGSEATPRGVFITGTTYNGKYGYSMRMHGIQEGINDLSFLRAILMHGYEGIDPTMTYSSDPDFKSKLQISKNEILSWGCTMLSPIRSTDILNRLKDQTRSGGSLYYNYSIFEKELGENYCANEKLLMRK